MPWLCSQRAWTGSGIIAIVVGVSALAFIALNLLVSQARRDWAVYRGLVGATLGAVGFGLLRGNRSVGSLVSDNEFQLVLEDGEAIGEIAPFGDGFLFSQAGSLGQYYPDEGLCEMRERIGDVDGLFSDGELVYALAQTEGHALRLLTLVPVGGAEE